MFSPTNPPAIKRGNSFWEETEWDTDYDSIDDYEQQQEREQQQRDDDHDHERCRRSTIHLQPKKKLRVTTDFSEVSSPTHQRSLVLAESSSFDVDSATDSNDAKSTRDDTDDNVFHWSPIHSLSSISLTSPSTAKDENDMMFKTPSTQKHFVFTSPPPLPKNLNHPSPHQIVSWESFIRRDDINCFPFLPVLDDEDTSSCFEDESFVQRFLQPEHNAPSFIANSDDGGHCDPKHDAQDERKQVTTDLESALTDLKLQKLCSPSAYSSSSDKENAKPRSSKVEDTFFKIEASLGKTSRSSFKCIYAMRGESANATADAYDKSIPPRRKIIHIARAA